jgi:hypothetical protein
MVAQETSVRLSLPLGVGAASGVGRLDGNSIMPSWDQGGKGVAHSHVTCPGLVVLDEGHGF